MSYCEHCEGQRFDRARILRALRQVRKELLNSTDPRMEDAIELAIQRIRSLDIPHLELIETGDEIVH
jgi:hypothetical protein